MIVHSISSPFSALRRIRRGEGKGGQRRIFDEFSPFVLSSCLIKYITARQTRVRAYCSIMGLLYLKKAIFLKEYNAYSNIYTNEDIRRNR
jgi:hypothetical protein